jgi:hypothetical protein
MEVLIETIARNWFWSVIGVIALAGIGFSTIKQIIVTSARERTRREIAAYIAEGSMTPEQGERLMRANTSDSDE